jgi:hypothetical protein
MKPVRIGIVDGPLAPALSGAVEAVARFSGSAVTQPGHAGLAHGTHVARLVLEGLPTARLLSAQVFHEGLDASVAEVAQAIAWLAAQRVDVINMSFGLRSCSPALEAACRQAHEAGVLLVASAPARGGAVYPAAFEACIAVSGDARCRVGEVSWLGLQGVDFGTHPFLERDSAARGGGASYAAARFSGLVGALLARGVPAPEVRPQLHLRAAWVGPEKRHA